MAHKTFEEQFPSLKGKGGDNHCSGCECDGSEPPIFSINEVKTNCLDKQKVREAIEKPAYHNESYERRWSFIFGNNAARARRRWESLAFSSEVNSTAYFPSLGR